VPIPFLLLILRGAPFPTMCYNLFKMAFRYKVTVDRDSISAKLFVGENDIVNVVDPDDEVQSGYLIKKQMIIKELISSMRSYDVESFKVVREVAP